MNGFMIVFVTVMVVTFNVAAGQNTTLSCSQEDVVEHNRLVDELNSGSCSPCGNDTNKEEQDDCNKSTCCEIYASAEALRELCGGSIDKRGRDVNILSKIKINIRIHLDRVCIIFGPTMRAGAPTMAAGATVIAFTALAATMF